MAKKLKVKICGLNDSVNIQEVASLKPDFIGFIFYPSSPRNFTIKECPNIPSIIQKVGVFVNATAEEIVKTYVDYHLNFVQLHGHESPELCYHLYKQGIPVIKVFSINENFDFCITSDYEPYCEYFLMDSLRGGSGKTFDWNLLKNYQGKVPFLLAGGISLENLSQVLDFQHQRLIGVDLNSRWEVQYGIKNIELLKKGLEKLNEYDKT
ncbi:MAG: N-(5'-phosphoribosyl)anthranilate isomerase [Bacteroidia bacterium]|nr:MAG: N-(5'-phosphoribosyl)anthranilate isomerase [Bacteroidia bacterium]